MSQPLPPGYTVPITLNVTVVTGGAQPDTIAKQLAHDLTKGGWQGVEVTVPIDVTPAPLYDPADVAFRQPAPDPYHDERGKADRPGFAC